MKCVSKDLQVRRVSNEQAERLVLEGWYYVNKGAWKQSPNTTWKQNFMPPNSMSENKKRRIAIKNHSI